MKRNFRESYSFDEAFYTTEKATNFSIYLLPMSMIYRNAPYEFFVARVKDSLQISVWWYVRDQFAIP